MTSDITEIMKTLAAELAEEARTSKSPEERQLHDVATKLLVLERDMKAPGATRSSEDRVDRLLEALAKERF